MSETVFGDLLLEDGGYLLLGYEAFLSIGNGGDLLLEDGGRLVMGVGAGRLIIAEEISPISGQQVGSGDEERRKWLEWREKKYRQRRPLEVPVVRPVPVRSLARKRYESLPGDVIGTADLLVANMKAAREQQAALETENARKRAIDEDDEEALMLLLESL